MRQKLSHELQAETRVELDIVLGRDALYSGPLPLFDAGYSPSGKPTYHMLTPNQLQTRAQTIVKKYVLARETAKDMAHKLTTEAGGEYETCSLKSVEELFAVPLIELRTWANSYDFRVDKERGIRRFNKQVHRLRYKAKEWYQLIAFDCMVAGLTKRLSQPQSTQSRERTKTFPYELMGRPTVVDADTIILSDTRIRLRGIDAPEKEQRCSYANGVDYLCGVAATEELRAKIGNASIKCLITGRGKYKRLLGQCHLGDVDLSQWLVVNGYALAYRPSSMQYVLEEETAKSAKRGIWSGSFEKPWEWRRKH